MVPEWPGDAPGGRQAASGIPSGSISRRGTRARLGHFASTTPGTRKCRYASRLHLARCHCRPQTVWRCCSDCRAAGGCWPPLTPRRPPPPPWSGRWRPRRGAGGSRSANFPVSGSGDDRVNPAPGRDHAASCHHGPSIPAGSAPSLAPSCAGGRSGRGRALQCGCAPVLLRRLGLRPRPLHSVLDQPRGYHLPLALTGPLRRPPAAMQLAEVNQKRAFETRGEAE